MPPHLRLRIAGRAIAAIASSALLSACLAGCGASARAPLTRPVAPAAPSASEEAERWIEKLGSTSWEERERATGRLLALGEAARMALEKAAEDPDLERASRSLAVLHRLDELVGARESEELVRIARARAVSDGWSPDELEPPIRQPLALNEESEWHIVFDLIPDTTHGGNAHVWISKRDRTVARVLYTQ